MRKKIITVLVVPILEKPYTEEISNDLKAFQKIVGGYIEVIALSDRLMLICNENGKLEGLAGNRRVCRDIIVGNFFVAADGGDGEFTSLTDNETNMLYKRFETAGIFTPEEVEDSIGITFQEW
jgi:hypothetical protein